MSETRNAIMNWLIDRIPAKGYTPGVPGEYSTSAERVRSAMQNHRDDDDHRQPSGNNVPRQNSRYADNASDNRYDYRNDGRNQRYDPRDYERDAPFYQRDLQQVVGGDARRSPKDSKNPPPAVNDKGNPKPSFEIIPVDELKKRLPPK